MTINITLNQTTGLNSGYVICSVINWNYYPLGNNTPTITTIAPESSVLFKQVGGTPILTPIPFSFSDINITNGYYIEIIVSPTINRTDGQIMGGFGGSTMNQDFSSSWGNGQFFVTCVATN